MPMTVALVPVAAAALAAQLRVLPGEGGTALGFGSAPPFHRSEGKVAHARSFSLGGTTVVLWQEGGSDRYAVSLDGRTAARVAESSGMLRLKFAEFDPLKERPVLPEGLAAAPGMRSAIVQFVSQPLEEYRRGLAAVGVAVRHYLPDDAYVVEVPEGALGAVRALPYVRWAGPFEPAYRLDPALLAELGQGRFEGSRLYVQVSASDPHHKATVAARAALAGAAILDAPAEGCLMEVYADAAALRRLAAVDGVLYIERRGEPSGDMDIVRAVSGANAVETAGGFDGSGVNVHDIDAGFLRTHVDYASRLTVRGNPGTDSHGTATAGIVAGNGTGNPAGRGMLPTAGLVVSGYQTGWSTAGRLSYTQATVDTFNCVVETNSWGDPQTTQYTSISSGMDEIVYKTDLVILNSMSNLGNQNVRPQAWAKNVVGIGAVYHFNNANTADDRWDGGASVGPAADQRTKPELCFYYDSIFCPTSGANNAYTSGFGGTSAATPMSAGAFGIFFDMWNEGVFGNSTLGTTVFANRAKSTTARAFLVNTASMYQSQADITRNVQGWGRPNLSNLWNRREQAFWVDETDVLLNLEERSYRVYVPAGTPEFRATMAYNDYWAAANANPTRVNNLSLKVVAPGGTTYWGNNGMTGASGSNTTTPGGSADTRNNLQNVYIANPPAGTYVVTVKAESLPQDGRAETPGVVDADYALVVTGVRASATPSAMTPYAKSLLGGAVATLARSENSKLELRRPLGPDSVGTNVMGVEVTGTLPFPTVSKLDLLIEPESSAAGAAATVQYYDFAAGRFETVGTVPAGSSKSAAVLTPAGGLARFVQAGTNAVRARVVFSATGSPAFAAGWAAKLDHVRWQVAP